MLQTLKSHWLKTFDFNETLYICKDRKDKWVNLEIFSCSLDFKELNHSSYVEQYFAFLDFWYLQNYSRYNILKTNVLYKSFIIKISLITLSK